MFTGLIETVGKISEIIRRNNYLILSVTSDYNTHEIEIGESIACDGVCLTVVKKNRDSFTVEASQETIERTILSGYKIGSSINLERAMQVGSRLGGHFVTGHVDTQGTVNYIKTIGGSVELAVKFDDRFDKFVIDKGSIAINGISLTINSTKPGWLSVNLTPHTVNVTTIGLLKTGDNVNLEFDMIGKYVNKLSLNKTSSKLTKDKLFESGW